MRLSATSQLMSLSTVKYSMLMYLAESSVDGKILRFAILFVYAEFSPMR